MKELYELKDNLCDELKKYGKKELSAGSLDVVDKLSHTIKNIDRIIENDSEGYSNASRNYSGRNYRNYDTRNNHDGVIYNGMSARGRSNNPNRDNRGRYSSEGYSYDDFMTKLYDLIEEAPDERMRQEVEKFIRKIESM